MKKKRIGVLLAALFAFTGTGCSATDARVSFDAEKPWQQAGYERCEYEIQKIFVGGGEDIVVAQGSYISELSTLGDDTTVTNEFTLTYSDKAEATSMSETGRLIQNRGLTDASTAEVVFKKDSLVPVSAERKHTVAQRPLCAGDDGPVLGEKTENADGTYSYTLPAALSYADPRGYTYTADYEKNTAKLTTTEGNTAKISDTEYRRTYTPVEKNFTIANNTRFDNEQLAHLVRALEGTRREGSAAFYLSNFYDSYIRGEYIRYAMSLSCAEKHQNVTLDLSPDAVVFSDSEGELEHADGKYTVPCVQASVSISSSTPGPAVSMLITDPNITVAERSNTAVTTKKLLVQMTFTEYSYGSAGVNYRTIYTLKNYSLTPGK